MSDGGLGDAVRNARAAATAAEDAAHARRAAEEVARLAAEEAAYPRRLADNRRRDEAVAAFIDRVVASAHAPTEIPVCGELPQRRTLVGRRAVTRPKRSGWVLDPYFSSWFDGSLTGSAPSRDGLVLLADGSVHHLLPCVAQSDALIPTDALIDKLAAYLVEHDL